jgi:hypothetical protein
VPRHRLDLYAAPELFGCESLDLVCESTDVDAMVPLHRGREDGRAAEGNGDPRTVEEPSEVLGCRELEAVGAVGVEDRGDSIEFLNAVCHASGSCAS